MYIYVYIYIYIYLYIYIIFIYINDLIVNLISTVKLVADHTSLFSEICDLSGAAKVLNNDLRKIRDGASNGKLLFTQIQPNKLRKLFF